VWTPIKYKQMQYYKEWGHVYQGVVWQQWEEGGYTDTEAARWSQKPPFIFSK
jgi:hypothetical protein